MDSWMDTTMCFKTNILQVFWNLKFPKLAGIWNHYFASLVSVLTVQSSCMWSCDIVWDANYLYFCLSMMKLSSGHHRCGRQAATKIFGLWMLDRFLAGLFCSKEEGSNKPEEGYSSTMYIQVLGEREFDNALIFFSFPLLCPLFAFVLFLLWNLIVLYWGYEDMP